tara:strand:- start:1511 stop:1660 length:150 start_codon:yes stop_codon:yes gene_type:complete
LLAQRYSPDDEKFFVLADYLKTLRKTRAKQGLNLNNYVIRGDDTKRDAQ